MTQFFNCTVNSTSCNYATPLSFINHFLMTDPVYGATGYIMVGSPAAPPPFPASLNYVQANTGLGSSQLLTQFHIYGLPNFSVPSPVYVNITEYGVVGQFISGNFNGTLSNSSGPVNVNSKFRVKGNY